MAGRSRNYNDYDRQYSITVARYQSTSELRAVLTLHPVIKLNRHPLTQRIHRLYTDDHIVDNEGR